MAEAMTEIYEVKEVEGKGLGCVALKDIKKGTLILKEVPQMRVSDMTLPQVIKEASEAFNKMNKNDQKEYLSLFDYSIEMDLRPLPLELKSKLLSQWQRIFEMSKKDEKVFKVMMIFSSNASAIDATVGLKNSRFNHACRPNAISMNAKCRGIVEFTEVVAISDIKAGEEITVSYTDNILEMQKKNIRQEILLNAKCFVCSCNLCKEEEDDNDDDTIEELFEEIENLEKQRRAAGADGVAGEPGSATRWRQMAMFPCLKSSRQIDCYKELYRRGKAKKVHPICLFSILRKGFESAVAAFTLCTCEEFEFEAKNFAKTADKFDKFVGSQWVTHGHERPDFWKQRYQNFEEWVRLYINTGNTMRYYVKHEEGGVDIFVD